jgi:thioredoxin reductase
MTKSIDVAIIGAGPYGLSLASYLAESGVNFRIFGHPMETWRTQMPEGMFLKSEGFASTLYDPSGECTLARYCKEKNLLYADMGKPVRLQDFSAYGMEFQRRMVPQLEIRKVTRLTRAGSEFQLILNDGESLSARKVVMAVGISHFSYLPPALSGLPGEIVTHSSNHHSLTQFKNREVVVIGGGASAVDIAALLREQGASVQIFSRRPVEFHSPPGKLPRPFLDRLRAPSTPVGPGWRSWFCTDAPLALYRLPQDLRIKIVRRHLGPAPGWFVRDKIQGHVPLHERTNLEAITLHGDRAQLVFTNGDGGKKKIAADHVIAGTGYRVDLNRIPFLNNDLIEQIRCVEGSPVLSTNFESSIPGVYFVGVSAALSFGPLLRFACGAKFAAPRLARRLKRVLPRTSVNGAAVNS